jgi:ATP-dependent Lon protease
MEEEDKKKRPIRKAAKVCARKIDKAISKMRNTTPCKRKYSDMSTDSSASDSDYTLDDSPSETEESEELESEVQESEESEEESQEEESGEDLDDTHEEDEEELYDVEDEESYDLDDDYEEEQAKKLLYFLSEGSKHDTVPKKYNMKDESEIVNRFYTLITEQSEENSVDASIGEFKALTEEKQNELIMALENRPIINNSSVSLMLKILTLKVSPDIQATILSKYKQLQMMDSSTNEYYKMRAWLDKVVSIPFGHYKDIPVTLDDGPKCGEFMQTAMKCMDDAVFGQQESKLQILQFIGTKIANPNSRGLSLLLIGPPGIGKTTIIKNGIAKALGWPFQFISLSGDSDATSYTGHQLVYESSHCGKIVNSLVASKSMSTIMMFDELDKISQTAKGEEIMNLMIHLTDPVQNMEFEDKYLAGIPIDLSKVMFVFSANDINKIDKVLLDRMIVIDLKGYDLQQKTVIAENYLVPIALQDVNLTGNVTITTDILTNVIQTYANEEKGVRELKRSIEQITQKINMLRLYNSPTLPYHIPEFALPFTVKENHVKLFIKKKMVTDLPPFGMYM